MYKHGVWRDKINVDKRKKTKEIMSLSSKLIMWCRNKDLEIANFNPEDRLLQCNSCCPCHYVFYFSHLN
jgi:hypothetical protein